MSPNRIMQASSNDLCSGVKRWLNAGAWKALSPIMASKKQARWFEDLTRYSWIRPYSLNQIDITAHPGGRISDKLAKARNRLVDSASAGVLCRHDEYSQ